MWNVLGCGDQGEIQWLLKGIEQKQGQAKQQVEDGGYPGAQGEQKLATSTKMKL